MEAVIGWVTASDLWGFQNPEGLTYTQHPLYSNLIFLKITFEVWKTSKVYLPTPLIILLIKILGIDNQIVLQYSLFLVWVKLLFGGI
jgi:hypothetical protein